MADTTIKGANLKTLKEVIRRMEEPTRTSVTLGRPDIVVILPILKKEVEET